jgi:carbon starvation protein
VPLVFLQSAGPGSYMTFWTLFGTSNQLLAGLSLLGVTVWLRRSGRRWWFTALPAAFVMTVTVTSLVLQARAAFAVAGGGTLALANGFVAIGLLVLAGMLLAAALPRLRAPVPSRAS